MAQRVDIQYIRYYSEGSAAKKVAPVNSAYTAPLPQPKRRKVQRIYIDPVAILGTVVAVCMLIMMAVGVSNLQKEQHQTAVYEQYVEYLREENVRLQERYTKECDLDAIKQTALALGMIPKEEAQETVIYIDLPQPQQDAPVSFWQRISTFFTGLFA